MEKRNKIPFLFEGFYSSEFFLFYYCLKNREEFFQKHHFEAIKLKKPTHNYKILSTIFRKIFKIKDEKCDPLKKQEFQKNIRKLNMLNFNALKFEQIIQIYSKIEQPVEKQFYPFQLIIKGLILWFNKIRIFLVGSEKIENFTHLQSLFKICIKNLSLKYIFDESFFLNFPNSSPESIQDVKIKYRLTEKNFDTIYFIMEELITEFRKKIIKDSQKKEKFIFKKEYLHLFNDEIFQYLNLKDFLKMKNISKGFQLAVTESSKARFENEMKKFRNLEIEKSNEINKYLEYKNKIHILCDIKVMEKEKALRLIKEINQKVS